MRVARLREDLQTHQNSLRRLHYLQRTYEALIFPTTKKIYKLCDWTAPFTYLWHLKSTVTGEITTQENFLEVARTEFAKYFAKISIPHDPNVTFPTPNANNMRNDRIFRTVTTEDIQEFLKTAPNTTPGWDKITYDMWKTAHSSVATAIAAIATRTLLTGHWDPALKHAHILPIPKVDAPITVKNRRPIGLLPTLTKIITSMADKQLRDFAKKYDVISPLQQAYQAGCSTTNHGRVTKNLVEDARRNNHTLWILSIDKENAYGTMNHNRAVEVLDQLGMPAVLVNFVRELFRDFTAQVITGRGLTENFTIETGAIQGDPLSCLLFIITTSEPLIRTLVNSGRGYSSPTLPLCPPIPMSSFCDDDDIYSKSIDELRLMAKDYVRVLNWLLNKLNLDKTKITLTCPPTCRSALEKETLSIHNRTITTLPRKEDSRALGFPISPNNKPKKFLKEMFDATITNLHRLLIVQVPHSIFAILLRSKIQSKLLYRSPINPYKKTWLNNLEKKQTAIIKKHYRLPPGFRTAMIYLSPSRGGLGFPSLIGNDTTTFITHYAHALNSPNQLVRLTTRDRLVNEFSKQDPMAVNPNLSDPHRFLAFLTTHEAKVVHKPLGSETPRLTVSIWTFPLLNAFGERAAEFFKLGIHSLHTLLDNTGALLTRNALDWERKIITNREQYKYLTDNLTTNGLSLIPPLQTVWDELTILWKEPNWEEILGPRITSEEELEAWMDGSYQPATSTREESAGFSLSIYQEDKIVRSTQARAPGQQTIQRAEMLAAVYILLSVSHSTPLNIYLDSEHVLKHATIWRSSPTTSIDSAVNFDIVHRLRDLLQTREEIGTATKWTKVKSHSGVTRNDREDELANEARSLTPTPNLEWALIPPNTYLIIHKNLPIFDTLEWTQNLVQDQYLLKVKTSRSAWWYNIANIDPMIAFDFNRA